MTASEHPTVAQLFDTFGVEQWVAGNTPFLLASNNVTWRVTAGRLAVFLVEVEDGRAEGTRHHYLLAEPGDLLFGMDLEQYGNGQGFLAVGTVGTRLLAMPVHRLRLPDGGVPADLPELVDRWVGGLSAGSSRGIVPRPRADAMIGPGETVHVASGKRLRARQGVAWVSHQQGSSLFLGMEDPPPTADALFPVTADTWLQATGELTVSAVGTAAALGTERGWQGLEGFYDTLFRCEFFNTRLAAADELNRLQEKSERDRRIKHAALADLASVLARRRTDADAAALDDPMLAAFTLVGRRMGVEIKAPPKLRDGESSGDPATEIARASRLRLRRVTLQGRWWRHDTTPFVAFRTGHRPVAILPTGSRLELHDPAGGVPEVVTAGVASGLEPGAIMLYRPFPDRVHTPWDIFRFGARLETRDFVVTLLVGLGAGALGMLTPLFLGLLVDNVLPQASRSGLLMLALALAAVGITTTLFDTVRALGAARIEIKLSGSVQPAMWDRLLRLPASFFRQYTAGDLAQRVAYVDSIRQILTGATVDSLMTGVFSVFLFALLFYYSWTLALVATLLVAVAFGVTVVAVYAKLALQRSAIDVEGQIGGLVLQLLTGIAKLRVTGSEGRAFAQWASAFARQKRLEMRSGEIDARLEVFNSAYPIVSAICLFAVMISMVGSGPDDGAGSLSTGDFIAFNAAFATFLAQTQRLGVASLSVLSVVPLFDRARPILEARPEVDTTKADPGALSGLIEVDHLSFRYQADGPLVLDDVSVRLLPGEFVAIVGPSGSGKSTLLRILLGLETPETGSVYYDGRDVALLDVQKLRSRIGVVTQNAKIRAGTIFENIVGTGAYTMDDAWNAARMAGLEEDLARLPMGMHTVLQQGGVTLSGGQRQRLMIARAIVGQPRILFFDEATSALDNRTQAIVSQSLQDLQATRVAIAHRLSTVTNAVRIYVMDRGAIVQTGTYTELIAQDGLFANLVKRQLL